MNQSRRHSATPAPSHCVKSDNNKAKNIRLGFPRRASLATIGDTDMKAELSLPSDGAKRLSHWRVETDKTRPPSFIVNKPETWKTIPIKKKQQHEHECETITEVEIPNENEGESHLIHQNGNMDIIQAKYNPEWKKQMLVRKLNSSKAI